MSVVKGLKQLVWLASLVWASVGMAEEIITVKKQGSFDKTLAALQHRILDNAYKISIIQRCDFGLEDAGYKSEKYRVVYFGKHDEVKKISDAYPALSPFLPLRIVVVADGDTASVSSMSPLVFLETVTDPELVKIIKRWQEDITQLLKNS